MRKENGSPPDYLSDLYEEMYLKIKYASLELTAAKLSEELHDSLKNHHIGYKYMLKPSDVKRRREDSRFSFFNEDSIEKCIKSFFGTDYVLKHLGKRCVLLDEGDVFTETLDVGDDVGFVFDQYGRKKKTPLLEVKMKVLAWGKTSKVTGFPFSIVSFSLFADEDAIWDMEPELESSESDYVQVSLFDLV